MASPARHALSDRCRIDPRYGAVYDAVPRSADDLSVIRGIETREAAGLNRLGIYYFEQLANWTDSQAAAVADALGMSVSTVVRDRWTAQARSLVTGLDQVPLASTASDDAPLDPAPALPASGSRTITLLVCALLVGCFFVSWLNRRTNLPMTGILAAEMTSLRVPSDSRLLATHVTAGDEVFTGETLLTLEKTEHAEQIVRQAQRVQQLAEDLRQAKAQAALDLQWRSQQMDQEISDTQRRALLFQSLSSPLNLTPKETEPAEASSSAVQLQPVSSPREITGFQLNRVNALLFISGSSGATTLKSMSALSVPMTTAMRANAGTSSNSHGELLQLEAQDIETRLQRLIQLRAQLPEQVRMAAGVNTLRSQHSAAQKRLKLMESLSRETAVLCPAYGTVGQVRYQTGDRMTRDEVMVKILHTDRRYVIVHAPAQRIDELEPGTRLAVVFPGHDECQGVVANLPVFDKTAAASGTGMASVRVESSGRSWPDLPVGSKVDVRTR
jgi:multidrug resistance efflux pump